MKIYTGKNKELQNLVRNKLVELGFEYLGTIKDIDIIGYCTTNLKYAYSYDKKCEHVVNSSSDYGDLIDIPTLLDMKKSRTLKDLKTGDVFTLVNDKEKKNFQLLSNINGVGRHKYVYYDLCTKNLFGASEDLNIL